MSYFNQALQTVLANEGGFSNQGEDPGGATQFGISLRFLRSVGAAGDIDGSGDVDIEDVRAIDQERAAEIYKNYFWNDLYNRLLDYDVAEKLFDLGVNMGVRQAVRLLQQGINLVRSNEVAVDGIFGPETLLAANQTPRALDLLRAEAARFYFELCERDPQRVVFLRGWLRRAYG